VTVKEYWTISDVSSGLEAAVRGAFPAAIWVVGEIQGLDRSRHRDHWYFEMCETSPEGDTCRLSATLWKGVRDKLFGPTGRCAGIFDLQGKLDGTKIMALCRVSFYAPYGKISLHLQDINPEFTLGELEARRKALLEKLEKERAFERNPGLSLAEVPLTIGLITSDGSAAYNDFLKELALSGFGFRVLLCDARMQGEDALKSIPRAFAALQTLEPDLIALVRGGGSRLDLSWFDREEIVYAIVGSGVPVVTGIGHEIDVTLSQMVAHQGKKTPTAASAFIVDRVRGYWDHLVGLTDKLVRSTQNRIVREDERMERNQQRIALGCRLVESGAVRALQNLGQRLFTGLLRRIGAEKERLDRSSHRLIAGRHMAHLVEQRLEVGNLDRRLRQTALLLLDRHRSDLTLAEQKCRLLDPINVIRRGFALVSDRKGQIVTDLQDLALHDLLTIYLRDGKLEAQITKLLNEVNDGQEKARQLEIW